MNILAFAATNHKDSINRKLIVYTLDLLKNDFFPAAHTEILDLNDYELPIFRQDREDENGTAPKAQAFYDKIGAADAVIVSFAEHNGTYTAAYKNLFDWTSRISQKVYQDKPVIIMATSPGARGGIGVLTAVETGAPFFGMDIKAKLSVPSFQDNYDFDTGTITNSDIEQQIRQALDALR